MDEKCKNCENSQACVPFYLHENAMMHYNRANKRMLIARVVALLLMATGFIILGNMFLTSYNAREKGWQELVQQRRTAVSRREDKILPISFSERSCFYI